MFGKLTVGIASPTNEGPSEYVVCKAVRDAAWSAGIDEFEIEEMVPQQRDSLGKGTVYYK